MFKDRIERKWIDAFSQVFEASNVKRGDNVAIFSETQSREINVHLSELALLELEARAYHVVIPTPPQRFTMPVRSNGWMQGIEGLQPVVDILANSSMVIDNSVEGLMHTVELRQILEAGSRQLCIINEHPEALERLVGGRALKEKTQANADMLANAKTMHITSAAGTDLKIDLSGASSQGTWGICDEPGHGDTWPGGLVAAFPAAGKVNGTVVLDVGDLNLTFKRYLETPIYLTIENDFITLIDGKGLDVDMFRSYMAHWGQAEAYGVSHVGWGINEKARWEAAMMYDKRDTNGGEERMFAGSLLFSTGPNPTAGRETNGHYDLPMRSCTVELDGTQVVDQGQLLEIPAGHPLRKAVPKKQRVEMLSERYED